jgi:hypothetical protein
MCWLNLKELPGRFLLKTPATGVGVCLVGVSDDFAVQIIQRVKEGDRPLR